MQQYLRIRLKGGSYSARTIYANKEDTRRVEVIKYQRYFAIVQSNPFRGDCRHQMMRRKSV